MDDIMVVWLVCDAGYDKALKKVLQLGLKGYKYVYSDDDGGFWDDNELPFLVSKRPLTSQQRCEKFSSLV